MTAGTRGNRSSRFRLDFRSGVPVYRQIIDQVLGAIAAGAVSSGDQLPTVRKLAVDLSINPNTVIRAYHELELRGVLDSQQGTGTFVTNRKMEPDGAERRRVLDQFVAELVARAGESGFTVAELIDQLVQFQSDARQTRR